MWIMRTATIWSLALGMFLTLSSGACSSSSGGSSEAGAAGHGGNVGAAGRADASGTAGDARDDVASDAAAGGSDGGGAGIGGASGTATDGGAMDAAGDIRGCLGSCFEALTADCPKVIGCTEVMTGGETVICYANGVKELRHIDGQAVDGTVKKPDGNPCYTWTLMGTDQTFMDVGGQVVAQLNVGATESLYTSICQPGQVLMQVNLSTPECRGTYAVASQSCTAGACSW
jgi:hypothetical protein